MAQDLRESRQFSTLWETEAIRQLREPACSCLLFELGTRNLRLATLLPTAHLLYDYSHVTMVAWIIRTDRQGWPTE